MFFHPTVLKWILYISAAKIALAQAWSVIVYLAYAFVGSVIIFGEWIMKVVSDFMR
jgi:hypothetical protein